MECFIRFLADLCVELFRASADRLRESPEAMDQVAGYVLDAYGKGFDTLSKVAFNGARDC